ncbi:hypothetical protein C8J56DRAFT_979343 [Mycena floridula]|nr:hypothetical protein C8J56DRAFT_979343 [Mycena floridula]
MGIVEDEEEKHDRTPSLLDFPDEVLLSIFNHSILFTELYSLALLSKRLHYICLPLFLALHGISNPELECNLVVLQDNAAVDALSALGIALYLNGRSSIQHLSFSYIPRSYCRYDSQKFNHHIGRLLHLLHRVAAVRTVSISVGRICDICNGHGELTVHLAAMPAALEKLVNLLMEKSCSDLTFTGKCWRDSDLFTFREIEDYNSRLVRQLASVKQWVKLRLQSSRYPVGRRGLRWEFCPSRNFKPQLSPAALSSKADSLQRFSIQSSHLLTPPLSSLTLQLIEFSRVRNLELSGVMLRRSIWTAMLPCVAKSLQSVRELTICRCNIPFKDLAILLSKVPKLTSLSADGDWTKYSAAYENGYPSLPHLRKISAAPFIVQNFLHTKDSLPSLESCYLRTALPSLEVLHQYLTDIHSQLSLRNPDVLVGLECNYYYAFRVISDLDEFFPTSVAAQRMVKTVNLDLGFDLDNLDATTPVLKRWLSMFPGIQHASVKAGSFDENIPSLVEDIRKLNPDLETLEVNGMLYET